ncbi:MAG: FtsX-like permease family protein [Ktedonobacteraceae bacterium]
MKTAIKPAQPNLRQYDDPGLAAHEAKIGHRFVRATRAVFIFTVWSLRRRGGQFIPVVCAFLLLVCSAQIIGMLHDIASTQTQQKIAQSWRGPYDLLVRPPTTVSQLERSADWIDPQSALESYGGISLQQTSAMRSLAHVMDITPFATVGWQNMAIQLPVQLPTQGLYHVSATWSGQTIGGSDAYVDVTDLAHLTTETPTNSPAINYLVAQNSTTPVVFTLSVPTLQAIVGVPTAQQSTLTQSLLAGTASVPTIQLSVHVEKLLAAITLLPACMKRIDCWQPQVVRQGTITYQSAGVQLLRFSHTTYGATSQQIANGQLVIAPIGSDMQGLLYRLPLTEHIAVSDNLSLPPNLLSAHTSLLPLTAPERLPLLPAAVRFIPLAQACAITGASCYSGVYIRLSGVEHYSQQSLAVLQATSAAITARTGLHVDILDGSSLRTMTLSAPATSASNYNSTIHTSWRVIGVAVQIVHGLDTLQETLLLLCSLVCLLAIGIAGVLVGSGRKKDVLLLQQLGWQSHLLVSILLLDALLLCIPGGLVAALFIMLAGHLWQSSLPPTVLWLLLGIGILLYCCALIAIAFAKLQKSMPQRRRNAELTYSKLIVPLVNTVAITTAVFLIAIEYLLVTGFNQVLVLTVLGSQVRAALETSQLALLLLILLASLLTVALCTILLVRGKREEVALLAMVGWERRAVLLRLLWSSWGLALLSGGIGVLLALGLVSISGVLPSVPISLALLLGGPLAGVVLVSLAALGPAWHETQKVFVWK